MRRWSLALLFTLASPALAQAPEPAPGAPAPAAQQEPPAPSAEPKPAPEAAAPAPKTEPAPTPKAEPAPAPKAVPAAPSAPAPAPKPQAAPPPQATPPPSLPGQKPAEDEEAARRDRVKTTARFIFENLLNGDARRITADLLYPFQLEDKRYNTPEELTAAWVKQLRTKRTDLITLYDIEVLTWAEMEKKYGKPPARLGYGNLRDPDIYAAVGNLSGHAAILLFKAPAAAPAKAFAYTD